MTNNPYQYRIFDCVLESYMELPELVPFQGTIDPGVLRLTFTCKDSPCTPASEPNWFHHWYLPNGAVSISCGKINGFYYLRFPGIADFEISIQDNAIRGFPADGVDMFTMRHLLLDQVIPRLLSHQGHLILHASAVCVNDNVLLFLGESGQGKSTLAMALQQYGCSLLTDDCVKLEITDSQITCIPNYIGARLWPDSMTGLDLQAAQFKQYDSGKVRLYVPPEKSRECPVIPVKAVFFLGALNSQDPLCCSCTPVTGTSKFMEMNKHCFPLDITDQVFTRQQFENIARVWKMDDILFSHLHYPRDYRILPTLCATILTTCTEHSVSGNKTS